MHDDDCDDGPPPYQDPPGEFETLMTSLGNSMSTIVDAVDRLAEVEKRSGDRAGKVEELLIDLNSRLGALTEGVAIVARILMQKQDSDK